MSLLRKLFGSAKHRQPNQKLPQPSVLPQKGEAPKPSVLPQKGNAPKPRNL